MRKVTGCLTAILLVALSSAAFAGERVSVGVSIGDEGIRSFHIAIGEYYRVPEQQVVVVQQRRIPEDEIPVVMFVSKWGRARTEDVINLRLGGRSWADIFVQYHINPAVLYVPVAEVSGPPYGKAYGHYKDKQRRNWRTVRLDDDDVVNLVNLKFISEHSRCSVADVIKLRTEGRSFAEIYYEGNRPHKEKRDKNEDDDHGGKHGKGRHKHHDED
jgi:hypothetical protein